MDHGVNCSQHSSIAELEVSMFTADRQHARRHDLTEAAEDFYRR